MSRLVVVLPLRPGSREHAARLLAGGLPFEPGAIGLDRYDVFLTDADIICSFAAGAAGDDDVLETLARKTAAWAGSTEWKQLVAGPARLGRSAYSWARPAPEEGVLFSPTPGPGDSDGGDVFTPAE